MLREQARVIDARRDSVVEGEDVGVLFGQLAIEAFDTEVSDDGEEFYDNQPNQRLETPTERMARAACSHKERIVVFGVVVEQEVTTGPVAVPAQTSTGPHPIAKLGVYTCETSLELRNGIVWDTLELIPTTEVGAWDRRESVCRAQIALLVDGKLEQTGGCGLAVSSANMASKLTGKM
jgi:hypothetical protein